MRSFPEIHWAEGMFLRPQHLQLFAQQVASRVAHAGRQVQPFYWGLSRLEVAEDQLEAFRFEARALVAVLEDGTPLEMPIHLRAEPRSFKSQMDQSRDGRLVVYLGVPRWREGEANTLLPTAEDERPAAQDLRYRVETFDAADENSGGERRQIEVRKHYGRFFFGDEDREGYECLPIALVQRAGHGKNTPVLDDAFVPPVTDISAWGPLRTLGEAVVNKVEARYRVLHAGIDERSLVLDTDRRGGWQVVYKLQIVGSFLHVLRQLVALPGIHPFQLYLELSRLAGELSIFEKGGAEKLSVPLYDHNELGRCFHQLTSTVNRLLDQILTGGFLQVPFLPEGELLVARFDDSHLRDAEAVYLCVESKLSADEVDRLLRPVKIGAAGDLPLFRIRRLRGLEIALMRESPRSLPSGTELHYYSIAQQGSYWQNVAERQEMAISDADARLTFSLFFLQREQNA